MIIQTLEKHGLIKPPHWLSHSVQYMVMGGSVSYGMKTEDSDIDCLGFCIPPKEFCFPIDEILHFGKQKKRFENFVQHHVEYENKTYDLTIFNITRYFNLAMENNPNSLEILFTPPDCVLHSTQVGQMIREKRHIFLHKGLWQKHKGYAFSQISQMDKSDNKHYLKVVAFEKANNIPHTLRFEELKEIIAAVQSPDVDAVTILDHLSISDILEYYSLYEAMINDSSRAEMLKVRGMDVKFAAHTVRLMLQCEQMLAEGDLDLRRNSDHLKAIRRGEVPKEDVRKWFTEKEHDLEKLYNESKLPWGPREEEIRQLLLNSLETVYGNIEKYVKTEGKYELMVRQIQEIVNQ